MEYRGKRYIVVQGWNPLLEWTDDLDESTVKSGEANPGRRR
jgi:hypothetical protein